MNVIQYILLYKRTYDKREKIEIEKKIREYKRMRGGIKCENRKRDEVYIILNFQKTTKSKKEKKKIVFACTQYNGKQYHKMRKKYDDDISQPKRTPKIVSKTSTKHKRKMCEGSGVY